VNRRLSAPPIGRIIRSPNAGWSSPVARRAHNPKVAGSNPAPATTKALVDRKIRQGFLASPPVYLTVYLTGWIKLFIPFYELRQAQLGQGERSEVTRQIIEDAKNQPYQQREYRFLSQLDHPFIVKVHDFGLETLSSNQTGRLQQMAGSGSGTGPVKLPFIIAAYVDGTAIGEGIGKLGREGVIRVLRSLSEAVDYLHVEHSLLHLDIKSANVRVRPDGYPVLLDFALSQDLSDEAVAAGGEVRGGIDWDLTPFRLGTSSVAGFIQRAQADGISKQEFRDEAFPALDLFQVGLMLRGCRDQIVRVLTPAETRYFDLLVADLMDWHRVRRIGPG
jgi:serine/threonine protein kinase